jgi:NAD-dependent SIR2 family protein deacetylase
LSLRITRAFCEGPPGKKHEKVEMMHWTAHSMKCPKCGQIFTPEMVKEDQRRNPNSWKVT